MKKLMFVILLGLAGQTQAAIINTSGENFSYEGLTWTSSFEYILGPGETAPLIPAEGEIRTGNDPITGAFNGELEITGSDNRNLADPNDPLSGVGSEALMFTEATSAGTVAFSWDFMTRDFVTDPTTEIFDFFFWVNDGVGTATTQLSPITETISSGVESFLVAAGDLFGFSIISDDNNFGSATVDISGFSFTEVVGNPSPVPLPPAFILFGIALAGLGFVRKKSEA